MLFEKLAVFIRLKHSITVYAITLSSAVCTLSDTCMFATSTE